MKKLDVNFAKPSEQQLNSLLEHYQTGPYAEAEKLATSFARFDAKIDPDGPIPIIIKS